MPRKKSKSSGIGFSPVQREVKTDKGYVTIFDKVTSATNGEKKSLSWYKNTVRSLSSEYKKEPDKIIKEERRDKNDPEEYEDENILRKKVVQGHLYFFEYEAKMKWLPYYDKFPLVYVIGTIGDAFYGANLHYLSPKKRVKVINKLKQGMIDLPRNIIHKYIIGHARSLYLDLASEEWETSILLPIEDFVTTKGTGKIPYDRELVWAETDKKYQDKLTAQRIIKGYGDKQSKEMAK
jgi:hypothetical protein